MRLMRGAGALLTLLVTRQALAFGGYDVWLLTAAPGEELFARFGHNALLVRERVTGKNWVYNYGTFDGGDPALVSKYLGRELKYWLSVSDLARTLDLYRGRTLWAQHLDLPAASVDELVAELRRRALPENREYLYDHFHDNCSTRIRDILDEVTHGALRGAFAHEPSGSTVRREIEAILGPVPFVRFAVSYLMSGPTDRPATRWETQFLPRHLRDAVRDVRIVHPDGSVRPLVAAERMLLEGMDEPTVVVRWPLLLLAVAFLLPMALAALGSGTRAGRIVAGAVLSVWGLAAGIGGVLMIYLWTTQLPDAQANGNLLFHNPLHLVLVPLGIALAAGRLSARGDLVLRALLWTLLALATGDLAAHALGWAHQSHLGLGLVSAAFTGLSVVAIRTAP